MSAEPVPETEFLPAEKYLGPRRYKIHALCHVCGEHFSWITTKLDGKDRECQKKACKQARFEAEVLKAATNMAKIIAEQRAPGHIGENQTVKAIDTTANIVMEDYGLGDLKDNVREGDNMVPSLPATGQSGMKMAEAAHNYFGGDALKRDGMSRQAQILGQMAINGAFKPMAANPGKLTATPKNSPPLTLVRTEKIA